MVNPKVIEYLYPQAVPLVDFVLYDDGRGEGPVIAFWKTQILGRQPTREELAQTEASAPFQAWLAEHGGNATATARRVARDAFQSPGSIVLRAALSLLLDEVNTLRAQHGLAARTMAQFRTAINNKITAGDGD